MGRPVTDAERDRVRELHAAGLSRNAIAAELGRPWSTISGVARALGLKWDRAAPVAAIEAAKVDAKARRVALALGFLDDAERLRQQLFEQAHVYSFGGKDNTFAEAWVEQPSFRDQRDIIQAANTAMAASLRLDQHDGDGSAEQVGSLLGNLFESLTQQHGDQPVDDG